MEKHHKIIIGSVGFLLIGFMVASSIFIYLIFTKLNTNYLELTGKITDTQIEVNGLKNNIDSIGSNFELMGEDITTLKDSGDFSKIVEEAVKSIVVIKISKCLDDSDCAKKQENVAGTGFFIYEGYFVTNYHVIEGEWESSINITTYDNKTYGVLKIADNRQGDISLLKINSSDYPSLKLADSTDVKIGEKVIAIGNPFGLEFSVTQGIISATNKTIKNNLRSYIQTDAPLNPGNSGGPLINMNGEVIGINNYKIFLTEGLGFALESNQIRDIVNEISLQKNGYRLV